SPTSGFLFHGGRRRWIRCRTPARERVECLLGLRPGFGAVPQDVQPRVGREFHHLEGQAEVPDDRVMDCFGASLVDPNVVRRPPGAELLASGRKLAYEV